MSALFWLALGLVVGFIAGANFTRYESRASRAWDWLKKNLRLGFGRDKN